MKVLFISREKRTLSIDSLLDGLGRNCELTVLRLPPDQVKKIRKTFKEIEYQKYDCVVINVPFRRWYNKARIIKRFPKLAVFDFDTNRNFLKGDDFYNKYTKFYKKLNYIKMICSGYYNTHRYQELGVDASFVSKGYNDKLLTNLGNERDIELGFIGRIDEELYKERKRYLKEIEADCGLKLLRTEYGNEHAYSEMLNRIKIFVSADVGYNEYMAKNFEAMACGCMLLAKRQGNGEEEALGLVDMENVVLYSDLAEAKDKIKLLLSDSKLVEDIARKGQAHAESNLRFTQKGEELYKVLKDKFG